MHGRGEIQVHTQHVWVRCAGGNATLPELAFPLLKLAVASGQQAPYAVAYNNYALVLKSPLHLSLQPLAPATCFFACTHFHGPCFGWRQNLFPGGDATGYFQPQAGYDPGALAPLTYTADQALINETFQLALNPNVSLASLQCASFLACTCAELGCAPSTWACIECLMHGCRAMLTSFAEHSNMGRDLAWAFFTS